MVAFSKESLPSYNAIISAAAYITATTFLLNSLIPKPVENYFSSSFHRLCKRFSSQLVVVIDEFDGLTANHMFEAANIYLGTKVSSLTHRIKVSKPEKEQNLSVTVDKNEEIVDLFRGGSVKLKWVLQFEAIKQISKGDGRLGNSKTEFRYFELSFHKKHKDLVLNDYLPYILGKAKEIKEEKKVVRLFTVDYNGTDYWSSVALNHPATFSTMAMDPMMKKELIEDLDRFISRKDYYRRVGKAWKRGYLFYGPPGTGKSSLVAAMANYLKFDVYDLDLREVQCNSDLRRLLIGSSNRSILVIEDIDCNIGFQNRESGAGIAEDDKITLSGLLNFIDGLWSSCGDERIIVFTTNHKDRLDPALLRPGRMDVHVEMSFCTFSGFRILAYNYLKIEDHGLFPAIEELLSKVETTPAEIAGELMKSDYADAALQGLVRRLREKDSR
ncbi:hypothetical protein M9H77_24887 [Catharanthus roseus]|uniref:Uncharacterized protein n=1 Tax=Catharanthus roseus TaxID=4058 RepID=A0ACC0A5L5_CATRO|nr:hypothetical protein M9H77_24887 [Catharanthus roseus]